MDHRIRELIHLNGLMNVTLHLNVGNVYRRGTMTSMHGRESIPRLSHQIVVVVEVYIPLGDMNKWQVMRQMKGQRHLILYLCVIIGSDVSIVIKHIALIITVPFLRALHDIRDHQSLGSQFEMYKCCLPQIKEAYVRIITGHSS